MSNVSQPIKKIIHTIRHFIVSFITIPFLIAIHFASASDSVSVQRAAYAVQLLDNVRAAALSYYSTHKAWPITSSTPVSLRSSLQNYVATTDSFYPSAAGGYEQVLGKVNTAGALVLQLQVSESDPQVAANSARLITENLAGQTIPSTSGSVLVEMIIAPPSSTSGQKLMLGRIADPSRPDGNRMETSIDMANNALKNIGNLNSDSMTVGDPSTVTNIPTAPGSKTFSVYGSSVFSEKSSFGDGTATGSVNYINSSPVSVEILNTAVIDEIDSDMIGVDDLSAMNSTQLNNTIDFNPGSTTTFKPGSSVNYSGSAVTYDANTRRNDYGSASFYGSGTVASGSVWDYEIGSTLNLRGDGNYFANAQYHSGSMTSFLSGSTVNLNGKNNVVGDTDFDANQVNFNSGTATFKAQSEYLASATNNYKRGSVTTFEPDSRLYLNGINNIDGTTTVTGGTTFSGVNAITTFNPQTTVSFNSSNIRFSDTANTTFDNNSTTTFDRGSFVNLDSANIVYGGSSNTTFADNSTTTFNPGSKVNFDSSNIRYGGTSNTTFDGNSTTTFNKDANLNFDSANIVYGASANTNFLNNSTTTFDRYANLNFDSGNITYDGTSNTTFADNSTTTFAQNANVNFDSSKIKYGSTANTTFLDNATVTFNPGSYINLNSSGIRYRGGSNTTFEDNLTTFNQGSKLYLNSGNIGFGGTSNTTFKDSSTTTFEQDSVVNFDSGNINYGATSNTTFEDSATYISNRYANVNYDSAYIKYRSGSETNFRDNSKTTFETGSNVNFDSANIKYRDGSETTFADGSSTTFDRGSELNFDSKNIKYRDGSMTTFEDNATVTFEENSTLNLNSQNIVYGASSNTTFNLGAEVSFQDVTFNKNPTFNGDTTFNKLSFAGNTSLEDKLKTAAADKMRDIKMTVGNKWELGTGTSGGGASAGLQMNNCLILSPGNQFPEGLYAVTYKRKHSDLNEELRTKTFYLKILNGGYYTRLFTTTQLDKGSGGSVDHEYHQGVWILQDATLSIVCMRSERYAWGTGGAAVDTSSISNDSKDDGRGNWDSRIYTLYPIQFGATP